MAKKPIVWVIDDDDSIRWVLEKGLTEDNLEVVTFDRANKAIKKLETDSPDVILTDIKMPGASGCLLYTSPSPRDLSTSRMPSSA